MKFDFVRAIHKLYHERKLVIIISLVMAVIGVFMALSHSAHSLQCSASTSTV